MSVVSMSAVRVAESLVAVSGTNRRDMSSGELAHPTHGASAPGVVVVVVVEVVVSVVVVVVVDVRGSVVVVAVVGAGDVLGVVVETGTVAAGAEMSAGM
jgi:hypothetical protein